MLSERIYTLRRKQGLSQEQLAERIGVSRQAISKWEGGLSTPELDKLKALSECFGITLDELTSEQMETHGTATPEPAVPTVANRSSKLGIFLCGVGAVFLLLAGIMMIASPTSVDKLNESSVITLNGSGILLLLCVLSMIVGVILILRKK